MNTESDTHTHDVSNSSFSDEELLQIANDRFLGYQEEESERAEPDANS